MKFSVIIPARNEQAFIGNCLKSIHRAARPYPGQVQIIVVINRCSDDTEEIARSSGAHIVYDDSKNLSKIRNSGARAAEGEIILTLDADSTMSENLLEEVDQALSSGRYYGGGVMLKLERYSAGIILTALMFLPMIIWYRVSAGCLWCYRCDFEAIGGFNENLLSLEDVDFSIRLKAHGRSQGKKTKVLMRAYIKTSCRKFDHLGDWYFVKRPWLFISLLQGRNRQAADRLWYEFER